MKKALILSLSLLGVFIGLQSCKKNDDNGPAVKPYTVPTTYTFSNSNYTKSASLVKMLVEVDAYLKTANTGSTLNPLDPTKVNNMIYNTGSAFNDAALNTSGLQIYGMTTEDASLYKSFADSVVLFNTATPASAGTGGYTTRGSNKIIVGPTGLEYGQAFVKGSMGAMSFKEAVRLLSLVKTLSAADTSAAQTIWDEAFGHLGVPYNYDSSIVYASTDANRPVLWGGYLAERGKPIQAGGTIFQAFLKGRAAISGYDIAVRDAQVDIILAKWEQLAAAAALNYVTAPTVSSAIGNYGTQLHALSEGFGFIASFKYRSANSPLSATDYNALYDIIHKDFYVLLNQTGFTDLVAAQDILKRVYGL